MSIRRGAFKTNRSFALNARVSADQVEATNRAVMLAADLPPRHFLGVADRRSVAPKASERGCIIRGIDPKDDRILKPVIRPSCPAQKLKHGAVI